MQTFRVEAESKITHQYTTFDMEAESLKDALRDICDGEVVECEDDFIDLGEYKLLSLCDIKLT